MAESSLTNKFKLLLIGGSAGSMDIVLQLLPALRPGLQAAIVIVLHRKSNGESMLASLFASRTNLPVKEADEKEAILPGNIYIAPADYHLLIEQDKTFSLDFSEKINYSRPSIDVTFESAAEVYGPSLAALLLSGANADGAAGLKRIKEEGGYVMVQDPATAEVGYMPQYAINTVQVDAIMKPEEMIDWVSKL
jgi:two-component system, chemotaxis family, protein-glutamate methylesterase/glutaminase